MPGGISSDTIGKLIRGSREIASALGAEGDGAPERMQVMPVYGDLLDRRVDALCSSLHGSRQVGDPEFLAGRLAARGGPSLRAALDAIEGPASPLGTVLVTPGFDLPARKVFHIVTFGGPAPLFLSALSKELLRVYAITTGLRAALEQADEAGVTSMALPLLGAGGLGLPPEIAIDAMLAAVDEMFRGAKHLARIEIVTLDAEHFRMLAGRLHARSNERRMERALQALTASPSGSPSAENTTIDDRGASWMTRAGSVAASVLRRRAKTEESTTVLAPEESAELGTRVRALETRLADKEVEVANLECQVQTLTSELQVLRSRTRAATAVDPSSLAMPAAYALALVEQDWQPATQVQNLVTAMGVLVRYVAVLALADYEHIGAPDADLNQWLQHVLSAPPKGDGHWLAILRRVGPLVAKHPGAFFEGSEAFARRNANHQSRAISALHALHDWRNDYTHDNVSMSDAVAETYLKQALPLWAKAVDTLREVLSLRLLSVEGIHDLEPTAEGHRVAYHVRWLMGDTMVPRVELVRWTVTLPKRRLYLEAPDAAARFLPLHPFLQFEHCSITHMREAFTLDRVLGDEVVFATFRFPYTEQLQADRPRFLAKAATAQGL